MEIDTTEFNEAMKQLRDATQRSESDLLNQGLFDISTRAFETLPPGPTGVEVQKKRSEIHAYMNRHVYTRGRILKSGTFKRWGRRRQVKLMHLIVNARRGKQGKKGLQGHMMSYAAGKLSSTAQKSVGFLKAPFIPVIRGMWRLAKFGKPDVNIRSALYKIQRWPGSVADGTFVPSTKGTRTALSHLTNELRDHHAASGIAMVMQHYVAAIAWKAGKMKRQAIRELQKTADKFNSR